MQELRSFCEYLEGPCETQTTAMSHLYQVFQNSNLKGDVQKVVNSLISYANDNLGYKRSSIPREQVTITIRCLELIYGLKLTNLDIFRAKTSIKESQPTHQSRLSIPQM